MERAALGEGGVVNEAFAPVKLLWTNAVFVNTSCCGLIGKGDKFCTRRRSETAADDTCGVRAHARKADVQLEFIYYWETTKNAAYFLPTLDSRELLATAIWEMRSDEITCVEFKALFQAVIDGNASNETELATIKACIMDPSAGVGFTPRKKPRYSEESSWEFPDVAVLPTLEEGPDPQDSEAMSAHIVGQWKDTVQTVEALKTLAGRNNWYEREMESLGNDIDSLRSAMARVNDLVGSPADGVAFDLFAIMDGNEEALLDLDLIIQRTVTPQLAELDARSLKAQTELQAFKASLGNALQTWLGSLESQMRAIESSSTPDVLTGIVVQMRGTLVKEIFPAIRHLWKLYELNTVGPTETCNPVSTHPTGRRY
jgi:hypothetical protein